jgi:hypothetical protein
MERLEALQASRSRLPVREAESALYRTVPRLVEFMYERRVTQVLIQLGEVAIPRYPGYRDRYTALLEVVVPLATDEELLLLFNLLPVAGGHPSITRTDLVECAILCSRRTFVEERYRKGWRPSRDDLTDWIDNTRAGLASTSPRELKDGQRRLDWLVEKRLVPLGLFRVHPR